MTKIPGHSIKRAATGREEAKGQKIVSPRPEKPTACGLIKPPPPKVKAEDQLTLVWEILVPTRRNNGIPYRTRHHRAWDAQVEKIAGGLTILRPAIGKWRSPNHELFQDRMIPVRIACSRSQINDIIQRTLNHYPDQEAVMAYVISEEVLITHRKTN